MKMKNFEIGNFWNFSKIFDFFIFHTFLWDEKNSFFENFRSQKFSKIFNLWFWFWPKNLQIEAFSSIFFKIALDFQGGHDGDGFQAITQLYLPFSRGFVIFSLLKQMSTGSHQLEIVAHVSHILRLVRDPEGKASFCQ